MEDRTCRWELRTLTVGPLAMNAYLLCEHAGGEAMLVDPGDEPDVLLDAIAVSGCRLRHLVATHGHFDHVSAAVDIQEVHDLPLQLHADERPILEMLEQSRAAFGFPPVTPPRCTYRGGADWTLPLGRGEVTVIHVPGHSPGHVLLRWPGHALVGDLVFAESVGRTDLPGASFAQLERSIRDQVYTLPDDTVLHPGHGPETTVGHERRHNPFVRDTD